jgi:hypothetical protein
MRPLLRQPLTISTNGVHYDYIASIQVNPSTLRLLDTVIRYRASRHLAVRLVAKIIGGALRTWSPLAINIKFTAGPITPHCVVARQSRFDRNGVPTYRIYIIPWGVPFGRHDRTTAYVMTYRNGTDRWVTTSKVYNDPPSPDAVVVNPLAARG